ncbi:MAG: hypothetical protein FJY85_04700 [Deltaproteobacteria bacterium]|nr:hypothetical protein [Deltaproteobacteria bacterium]
MPKKTINVKEVIRDIKAGMHQNALMNKYHLSPGQLKSLMDKLEGTGLLERPEPQPPPEPRGPLYGGAFFTCPACGLSQDGDYDECPRCGVVVSKYEPPKEGAGTAAPADPTKKKVDFDGWSATAPKSYRIWKILAATVVLAVAVAAVITIKRHRATVQVAEPVPVQEVVSEEEGQQENVPSGPPGLKQMIEKKMPRVAPINPEVDAQMRKSMGGIGEALDSRTRAGEDLTKKP